MVSDREADNDRNCTRGELREATLGGNSLYSPSSRPKLQQRLLLSHQNPMTTGVQCSTVDAIKISINDNNDCVVPSQLSEHQQLYRDVVTSSNTTVTSGVASKIRSRLLSSSSFLSTMLVRRTISASSTSTSSSSPRARDTRAATSTNSSTCTRNVKSYSIFNREAGLRHQHLQPSSGTKNCTTASTTSIGSHTDYVPALLIEGTDYKQPHSSLADGGLTPHCTISTSCCLEEREASSPSFQADKLNTTTTTTTAIIAHQSDGTAKQGSYPYSDRENSSLQQQQQVIMGNSFCNGCTHNSTTQHSKSNGITCLETNGSSTIIISESKSFSSFIPFFRGPSLQDSIRHFLGAQQEERQEQQNDHPHIKNLLLGCTSVSQHLEKIKETISATKSQHGSIGLRCAGFEYRCTDSSHTRLFHIDTDTCITETNRQLYIADGCMYEEITRLAQETAQEFMIQEGDLQWIDICDKDVPVRALVSPSCINAHSSAIDADNTERRAHQSSTFLITTGKGCVRAGIFSRKHLIVTGLEASTALPHIREAKKREMRIVMIDPNARGDRLGMDTFELSMKRIFDKTGSLHSYNDKVYILAHSQAGAQLVRFLLDDYNRSEAEQLKIKAIAFTDSTHNIQWTKANPDLSQLLSGRTSIYLKSTPAIGTPNNSYKNTCNANNHQYTNIEEIDVGKTLDTDHYWKHRFGTIRTLSAGTSVHELVNWTGRTCIWEHFDEHLID